MPLLSSKELGELFRTFERSAVRMEAHQTYRMPAEEDEVRQFISGVEKPADFNADWHETVRTNASSGRRMQRIKLVRMPYTDYNRFLFEWVIADNVAAGEDYRIVDVTSRKINLPEQDFWIFDESTVVLLNFNPDGTLHNREMVDQSASSPYFWWRDLALKESVTFDEYRAGGATGQ